MAKAGARQGIKIRFKEILQFLFAMPSNDQTTTLFRPVIREYVQKQVPAWFNGPGSLAAIGFPIKRFRQEVEHGPIMPQFEALGVEIVVRTSPSIQRKRLAAAPSRCRTIFRATLEMSITETPE